MIGIDRKTGRTVTGFEQLVSRVTQVLTTPLTGRTKRAGFGSEVRKYLSANMTNAALLQVQSAALSAFYNPENGLSDFVPSRCLATRQATGLNLSIEGKWNGQPASLEVPIDATP